MGFPEWCLAKEKTWLTISLELFQTQQIASLKTNKNLTVVREREMEERTS